MTRQMTATGVKARLLALLDEVAAGDQIEITKHGRPVVRLVPAHGLDSLRRRFTEIAATTADDDEPFTTGLGWDLP